EDDFTAGEAEEGQAAESRAEEGRAAEGRAGRSSAAHRPERDEYRPTAKMRLCS
ncbi:unnamed protein product, partial [Nesidiocoris tenuis]